MARANANVFEHKWIELALSLKVRRCQEKDKLSKFLSLLIAASEVGGREEIIHFGRT